MARYKIVLEYDGTRYYGWQAQKGSRTIQGEFFTVFDKLFPGERCEFYGAGRTDSGVHALHQVAHLEIKSEIQPTKLMYSVNDLLPSDIHVLHVEKCDVRFHARYDAIARSYVYLISSRRTAFEKAHCWWIRDSLDLRKMNTVAKSWEGRHDFRSFTDQTPEEGSTLVEVNFIDFHHSGDLTAIHITGSHFLWKMVRRLTGILVEVGRGNIREKEATKLVSEFSGLPARHTAPPSGLYLHQVYYPGDAIQRGREYMPVLLNF